MPGEVIECLKCHHQMRWGYPSRAVEFAQSKRPEASEEEIANDFFEFNKGVLREKPMACNKCGAGAGLFKVIHEYA